MGRTYGKASKDAADRQSLEMTRELGTRQLRTRELGPENWGRWSSCANIENEITWQKLIYVVRIENPSQGGLDYKDPVTYIRRNVALLQRQSVPRMQMSLSGFLEDCV